MMSTSAQELNTCTPIPTTVRVKVLS